MLQSPQLAKYLRPTRIRGIEKTVGFPPQLHRYPQVTQARGVSGNRVLISHIPAINSWLQVRFSFTHFPSLLLFEVVTRELA